MGSGYVMLVNTSTSLLICYIESICCDANQQIWRISFKDVLLDTKQRYQQSVLYTNLKDTVVIFGTEFLLKFDLLSKLETNLSVK